MLKRIITFNINGVHVVVWNYFYYWHFNTTLLYGIIFSGTTIKTVLLKAKIAYPIST